MLDTIALQECLNSVEVNCGPLSDANCSGSLYEENSCLRSLTLARAVIVLISMTSGHFEWVSTTIRNYRPKNGPAKST